jgi:ferredoxin-NADP reductase
MTGWLDEQLGRITMYRLVLYCLIALAGMALLLMFAGNVPYSPIGFLGSIAISVGIAYGTNHLFGWLFGVRPHSESALITGIILSLLFVPPESMLGFVKLGLIAAIAMASKYVLVVRGRHVFNPAAIAIVIASISGLGYAGWWVATPGMIPITIIAGILILQRTKKQYVSLLFVIVAMASLFIQGTDPVTALVSWPLLFIGAIMLSEPLTLPPRAWQQYVEATIVGILMTVPLHYGRITMTPALALVIGNLIGWWFGQRRAIKLRYVGKKQLNESVYEVLFDTQKLAFESGQYMELSLPHAQPDSRGQRRVFSIVGNPGDEQISIGTKLPAKPSSFKRALMNLKTGSTVYATRIGGDFVLPNDPQVPVVCIAGGIGVTPYVSFAMNADRPIRLIYAVNNSDELSFVDILKQHTVDVVVVSQDNATLPDPEWRHEQGVITTAVLRELIDVAKQPIVYISGPPAMVMNVRQMVRSLGIKHIKVDEFSGY